MNRIKLGFLKKSVVTGSSPYGHTYGLKEECVAVIGTMKVGTTWSCNLFMFSELTPISASYA